MGTPLWLSLVLLAGVGLFAAPRPFLPHYHPVPIEEYISQNVPDQDNTLSATVSTVVHFLFAMAPVRKLLLEQTADSLFGLPRVDSHCCYRLKLLHDLFAKMTVSRGTGPGLQVRAGAVLHQLAQSLHGDGLGPMTLLDDLENVPSVKAALEMTMRPAEDAAPDAPPVKQIVQSLGASGFAGLESITTCFGLLIVLHRDSQQCPVLLDTTQTTCPLYVDMHGERYFVVAFIHDHGVVQHDFSRNNYWNWTLNNNAVAELSFGQIAQLANESAQYLLLTAAASYCAEFGRCIASAAVEKALGRRDLLVLRAERVEPSNTSIYRIVVSIVLGALVLILSLVAIGRTVFLIKSRSN